MPFREGATIPLASVGKRPFYDQNGTPFIKKEFHKTFFDEVTSPGPWNKGRLIEQKTPLKLQEIWAIRIRLQPAEMARDLTIFNLAINSKLRGCGLVNL